MAVVAVVGAVCVWSVARCGMLSKKGYQILYLIVAGPPLLAGVEERTVILLLYDLNCGGSRYPYDVLYLSRGHGLPETIERLFTCRSHGNPAGGPRGRTLTGLL